MICKNCIHFKVCKHKTESVYECEHFKEIITCKDCKYFIPDEYLDHIEYPNDLEADGLCDNIDKYTDIDRYCSSAKKKSEVDTE